MKTEFLTLAHHIGLFGAKSEIAVVFDPESRKTLGVHRHGVYNIGLPDCVDGQEAFWLLKNYIRFRHYPYSI